MLSLHCKDRKFSPAFDFIPKTMTKFLVAGIHFRKVFWFSGIVHFRQTFLKENQIPDVISSHMYLIFQAVGDVLSMLCHLVPLSQEPLVSKVCQLMSNAVARQQVPTYFIYFYSGHDYINARC